MPDALATHQRVQPSQRRKTPLGADLSLRYYDLLKPRPGRIAWDDARIRTFQLPAPPGDRPTATAALGTPW